MVFLEFCSFILRCCSACLSGAVFVASHTRLRPLYQTPKVNPSSLLPTLVKPTSSKIEGRLSWHYDLLRIKLMAECLEVRPVFLMQESPCGPTSTILLQWHFMLLKVLAPVRRAFAIWSLSVLSMFPPIEIGKSSD